MTGSKPKSSDDKLADDKAETPETSTAKKSGRVAFDARGNAVWEWSMSTGVFGRDVDNERLKKLEAPDLKIADDPPQKTKAFGTSPDERGPGFDPYNTHVHRPTDPQPKTTGVDPYNTVSSGRQDRRSLRQANGLKAPERMDQAPARVAEEGRVAGHPLCLDRCRELLAVLARQLGESWRITGILVHRIALFIGRDDFATPHVRHRCRQFLESDRQQVGDDLFSVAAWEHLRQRVQACGIIHGQAHGVFRGSQNRCFTLLPPVKQALERHAVKLPAQGLNGPRLYAPLPP